MRVSVVGAGTMGGGIAQVIAQSGFEVLLLDAQPELAAAGLDRIGASLDRAAQRGRVTADEAKAALGRIRLGTSFEDLAEADWAIEAVPEEISIKQQVFRQLDTQCPAGATLATNTSSLSVSEIAASTRRPERVVGMHFFNPPVAMPLIEVVRGSTTSQETVDRACALVRALGKTPVCVADSPGFIVNRVVRPFYNEALRLLSEGLASRETIDRAMRGAGFPMGPFELMDLIGNDVNLAVTTSIYEQFYGEPRFRPSPLQRRLVRSGALGQKTGRGWYEYDRGRPSDEDRLSAEPGPLQGAVAVIADGPIGEELAEGLEQGGREVRRCGLELDPSGGYQLHAAELRETLRGVSLLVDATTRREAKSGLGAAVNGLGAPEVPVASLALTVSTTEIASWYADPSQVCGFGYLPPLERTKVLEVAPGLQTSEGARQATEALAATLGKDPVVVGDGPGLVGLRLLSLIINEGAFALMEGVAEASDIDTAVRLGANYPLGPLEWADAIGVDLIYAILGEMQRELGDDRYRASPMLRRLVHAGWVGQAVGHGFFQYS